MLAPLTVAYVWRRQGRREAFLCAGLMLAVVGLVFVPFVALAPGGFWDSLWNQLSRPLQIESLGSGMLLVAHHLFGVGLTVESSHGSQNLAGTAPDVVAVGLTVLQAAALLATWILFARGPASRSRLLYASAAALVAFVSLGKVLSPQFLVWLIPVIPLVAGRRGLAASALLAGGARPHAALVPVPLLGARGAARDARVVARAPPRPRAGRAPRGARESALLDREPERLAARGSP